MNYKNIIFILLSGLFLTTASCKKEFLERSPETSISDSEFWKSANDLKLYANNWYSTFPLYRGFGTIGIYGLDADQGSDNMITMTYNTGLNGENVLPATGGWSYSNIRNVNYFLANYQKSTEAFDNIKPYVGEAYFFRAYFYFDLLKTYGDLPWVNKPLLPNSPELFDARLPRNVIVDSLLSDLDKAITYLPSNGQAQVSRINKQIAQLFQGRVALYEGTWEKYHKLKNTSFQVAGSDGNKYIQKAIEVTNNLIENSMGYGLDPIVADASNNNMGYWGLFNRTNYRSSPEIMLWAESIQTLNGGHNWHRYTFSGAGRGITKNMIDAYLCTDGNPISTSPLYENDKTLLNVVKNRDPRMVQSIYVNDGQHILTSKNPNTLFISPSFDSPAESRSATGYQLYKGHNPLESQQIAERGTTGVILFRFAEALLINAEAKAELGVLNQSDLDNTINKLRRRVNMPDMILASLPEDTRPEFAGLSRVINEVRRERRVELAFEGYRKDDLLRWAAMDEKIVGWKPLGAKRAQWDGIVPSAVLNAIPVNDAGYIELFKNIPALSAGYKFKLNRDYLSAIPTAQITLNKDKIKQNPGWE